MLVRAIHEFLCILGARNPCIVLLADLGLLLAAELLLLDDDLFHLFDRYGALHVDPLVLDHVLLFELQHHVHTANVGVGDEAEASWLVRALI